MAYNEDSSASGHDEPWIQWFCGLKGHEMFCEVERSYIEDGFNLYGLRACVSNFSDCLDLILDRIGPDDSDDSHLTQSACTLYGLIHARYIITAHGLDAMYNKYAGKDFGTCPLVQCGSQPVLPVGLKDEMGAETVKIFCPKCNQVFHPPPIRSRAGTASGVDGAAFGTTFPHLFLMTFSNLVPDPLPPESAYVPRVFGFRVHKSAQRRSSSSLPGALVSSNSQPAQPSPRHEGQQQSSAQPPVATQQASKQEPTELDDRSPAPAASASAEKGDEPAPAEATTSRSAFQATASASGLNPPPPGESASAAIGSAPKQEEVAGKAGGGGGGLAGEGEEDAASAKQGSRSSRGARRRRDGDNASTATNSADNAVGGGDRQQQQQSGGTAILMENPSKRRRKNNGTS